MFSPASSRTEAYVWRRTEFVHRLAGWRPYRPRYAWRVLAALDPPQHLPPVGRRRRVSGVLTDADLGVGHPCGDQWRVGNSAAGIASTSPDEDSAGHVSKVESPRTNVCGQPVADQAGGALAGAFEVGLPAWLHPGVLASRKQFSVLFEGVFRVPGGSASHVGAAESRHVAKRPRLKPLPAAYRPQLPVWAGETGGDDARKAMREPGTTGHSVRCATGEPDHSETLDSQRCHQRTDRIGDAKQRWPPDRCRPTVSGPVHGHQADAHQRRAVRAAEPRTWRAMQVHHGHPGRIAVLRPTQNPIVR